MRNTSLKRLYIRNNDIGDTGVLFLVSFLRLLSLPSQLQTATPRWNSSTCATTRSSKPNPSPLSSPSAPASSSPCPRSLSPPLPPSYPLLDPDRTGLGPVSKLYKDCCIFLQMLRLLSHADVPLHMPRDLLFHPGLPNHRLSFPPLSHRTHRLAPPRAALASRAAHQQRREGAGRRGRRGDPAAARGQPRAARRLLGRLPFPAGQRGDAGGGLRGGVGRHAEHHNGRRRTRGGGEGGAGEAVDDADGDERAARDACVRGVSGECDDRGRRREEMSRSDSWHCIRGTAWCMASYWTTCSESCGWRTRC